MVDGRHFRQSGRVVHLHHSAFLRVNLVLHVRHGGYDLHVELARQSLLYNLHVQQSEESATETESQRYRAFWLECQRCVVELQLLDGCAQVLEFGCLYRVNSGVEHRFHFLESGYGFVAWLVDVRYCVADLHFARGFDARHDVSYIAGLQFLRRSSGEFQHANLVGVVFLSCRHELHSVAAVYRSVYHLEVGDNAAV